MMWVKRYNNEEGNLGESGLRELAKKNGLDTGKVKEYLNLRFTVLPSTIINGVEKKVDCQCKELSPGLGFRDLLMAQKPVGRFAVLLSGGVDSSILATLYDSPETEFIFVQTLVGNEQKYFEMVSSKLIGKKHIVTLTPELYYQYACEIYDQILDPVGDAAIISVYAAAKFAKSIGIDNIVVGEGGDESFGGYWMYPQFRPNNNDDMTIPLGLAASHASIGFGQIPSVFKEYWDGFKGNCLRHMMEWDRRIAIRDLFLWKNVYGGSLAGVTTHIPYYHPAVVDWSEKNLKTDDLVDANNSLKTKIWLKKFALSLGIPEEAVMRTKMGFASEIDNWVFSKMREETGFTSSVHVQMYPIWSLKRWCDGVGVSFDWKKCLV